SSTRDWSSDVCSSDLPGMRRTAQREMVYNAIVRLGGHCTAEQITEELHHTKPGFPRSTVYRALEALTASGSVYAAHLGEGPTHRSEERRVGKAGRRAG